MQFEWLKIGFKHPCPKASVQERESRKSPRISDNVIGMRSGGYDQVSRQDSAYKRRILESDGVNMCPGLGWCVFVDLPRDYKILFDFGGKCWFRPRKGVKSRLRKYAQLKGR